MNLYFSKTVLIPALAVVVGLVVACKVETFSGSGGGSGGQLKKNPTNTGKAVDPDFGSDEIRESDKPTDNEDSTNKDDIDDNEEGLGKEDDISESEDEKVHAPQKCTATNGKVVSGATGCPAHYAAFTSDDGNSARIGCCPLPSKDILDKSSKAIGRGGSCQTNEIAVGSDGNGFMCRKINTQKYRLEAPQQVCYRGNGAAGGSGSNNCSNIIAQLQGLIGLENDRDGCVAQPYGAIMTQKTGKDCKDQKASVIVDKASGKPVKMFP